MKIHTIDDFTVYTKSFRAERRSFLKRIDRSKVIGLAIAFLLGLAIAGNIMGYAINWSN